MLVRFIIGFVFLVLKVLNTLTMVRDSTVPLLFPKVEVILHHHSWIFDATPSSYEQSSFRLLCSVCDDMFHP